MMKSCSWLFVIGYLPLPAAAAVSTRPESNKAQITKNSFHTSFQLVLRAAEQAADVAPVHEDDQCAADECDRNERRGACGRRAAEACKQPDAWGHQRGGRDRAERDV